MEYKKIKETESPIPIKDWIKTNRFSEKHTVLEVSNKVYIVISRGEQRTGGYDIDVKSIDEKENEIHITFEYLNPKPDEIVMQVITNPVLILEMRKVKKPIIFHILR